MNIPDRIIAIDPGVATGGIAVWNKGEPVKAVKMPRDLSDVHKYFQHLATIKKETLVFIEAISIFGSDAENPGKNYRIRKLTDNHAQMKAFLTSCGFKYMEVYPNSWQSRTGLKKLTKNIESDTERKNLYKKFAQNCFPEIAVTLWSADALCIIQYALTTIKSDPSFIRDRLQNVNEGLF